MFLCGFLDDGAGVGWEFGSVFVFDGVRHASVDCYGFADGPCCRAVRLVIVIGIYGYRDVAQVVVQELVSAPCADLA